MIKVTLGASEETPKEKPFPKLMKSPVGTIVLFYTKYTGILLVAKDDEDGRPLLVRIAEPYTNLDISRFTDYNEPITIQND